MVRYAQSSHLPCDPTPEEANYYEEQYKNIKGILSIKNLTKKIQPLFQQHLQQTAHIYSLTAHGTHSYPLFSRNKLIHAKQSNAIQELLNLNNYMVEKTKEFTQLQNILMKNLQIQFNDLLQNIRKTTDQIQSQYRLILEEQFRALRKQSQTQLKAIQQRLYRLQKQFDPSVLFKRNFSLQQISKIGRITKDEVHGYETLFKIVSKQTLQGLEATVKQAIENPDQQLVIDVKKIKKISCHDLWCLIQLIKTKIESPTNQVRNQFLFPKEDVHLNKSEAQINKQDILLKLEQSSFKIQTVIIKQLTKNIKKKQKNEDQPKLSLSRISSNGLYGKLTDFVKEKMIKKVVKSTESQIQKQFVKFNQDFNYQKYSQRTKTVANLNDLNEINDLKPQRHHSEKIYTKTGIHIRSPESLSTSKSKVDKFQWSNQRSTQQILVSKRQSFFEEQHSNLHYENGSIIEYQQTKNQADQQYSDYIKRMKIQRGPSSEDQKQEIDEEFKRKQQKQSEKAHKEQQKIYQTYQRKLDSELEPFKQAELFQSDEMKRIEQDELDSFSDEQLYDLQAQEMREQQLMIEKQIALQKQITLQRQIQKQIQAQKIQSLFNPAAKIPLKNYPKLQQLLYKPQFMKRDYDNSRYVEQWREGRRKSEQQRIIQKNKEAHPMDEQEPQIDLFKSIPDREQQIKIMKMYELQNQLKKKQQENLMQKRFREESHEEQFGIEDYRKEKLNQESLLQYAINQSRIGIVEANQPKELFLASIQSIQPCRRSLFNPFGGRLGQKQQQDSIDSSLGLFQKLLQDMFNMKTSFSLTDLKYNSQEYDSDYEDILLDEEAEQMGAKIVPARLKNQGLSRGPMSIGQINSEAENLLASKETFSIVVKVIQPVLLTFKSRDQGRNRPMTKLIVGDSTGIGILYMNYYFEVSAGCCLQLDNCRLSKHHQSYEINHHKSITFRNIDSIANLRVSSELFLSLIRKLDRERYEYDVRSNFNPRLSDCIAQFKRSRITIGELELGKPVIVSVCNIITGRKCILGDYTGKIQADLNNMRMDISIAKNDTLLLRRAKLQINRGTVVLVADPTTFVVKADIGFRFSHDMKFIPDKMLKANAF